MTASKELESLLEGFISAVPERKTESFGALVSAMKGAVRSGLYEDVANVLERAVGPCLDYPSAQSLYGIYGKLKGKIRQKKQKVRLAILSGYTTSQLRELIELVLFSAGMAPEIYEAEYGVLRQEILDAGSKMYSFGPTFVFLATGSNDLVNRPLRGSGSAEEEILVAGEVKHWTSLWETVHGRLKCQIIQNNFPLPSLRLLNNHEMRSPFGLGRFIAKVNLALQDAAFDYVVIHDMDYLAANTGRRKWDDERFYHFAKFPCAPECLMDYAYSVATIILAQSGFGKKCMVLDLDNTLWGGVIGDDGINNIKLGQGDPEGEAFLSFQRYLKGLRQRGVILAVCSKNQDSIAREVFEKHSEMVLRLEDISCFVANWDDKATNIRRIADELEIGLNSMVFVDDNPAERALVRGILPEVAVPELPADPSGFATVLDRSLYFQIVTLEKEDYQRTDYYRSNVERKKASAAVPDLKDFLASLKMKCLVGPIDESTLQRSVQLINRSNQFNLTTHRYSPADIIAMMNDKKWITRTATLKDRFGDNGLISVVLARHEGDILEIDTWLMSCRVLRRGVEQMLLNNLCGYAVGAGIKAITGRYIPTPKNLLVKDHYAGLGFEKMGESADGSTSWRLTLDKNWKPFEHFIEETDANG